MQDTRFKLCATGRRLELRCLARLELLDHFLCCLLYLTVSRSALEGGCDAVECMNCLVHYLWSCSRSLQTICRCRYHTFDDPTLFPYIRRLPSANSVLRALQHYN